MIVLKTFSTIKGELGEFQINCKIPLHQQKYLIHSVLSNLPWPSNFKKMSKMELSFFHLATLLAKVSVAMVQASDFYIYCVMT